MVALPVSIILAEPASVGHRGSSSNCPSSPIPDAGFAATFDAAAGEIYCRRDEPGFLVRLGGECGSLWDEERLIRKLEGLVKMLQGRANFPQVARDFGEVAQLTLRISLPEGKKYSADDLEFFLNYMGRQGNTFELVIYDTPAQETGAQVLRKMLAETQQRRGLYSARLQSAYSRPFSHYSAEELNERSPFYGVAQLVYSHAVIDIARFWIWTWMEANGDLEGSILLESYRSRGEEQPVSPRD